MFDLDDDHGTHTVIEHEPVDLDQPWNVGLIVGPSGTGKSTAADRLFGITEPAEHNPTAAVLDLFPDQLDTDQITGLLTSVGFSSPPAWLRPIDALSVGERFRVETALALAQSGDKPVCLDEFTSVVDRTVAQVGSTPATGQIRYQTLRPQYLAHVLSSSLSKRRTGKPLSILVRHNQRHTGGTTR